ncbi:Transient receptor putative cation channel sub V member 6 [Podochytrium sp. JEL0797]|nr:Transient receptor putative cation channel sub V member 6 [Podochytrium sp. JEL0797]
MRFGFTRRRSSATDTSDSASHASDNNNNNNNNNNLPRLDSDLNPLVDTHTPTRKPSAAFLGTSQRIAPLLPQVKEEPLSDDENQISFFNDDNLWQAVWLGDLEAVKSHAMELLKVDGKENKAGATRGEFERGAEGETILHLAILRRHIEVAKWLIDTYPSLVDETYAKHKYYGETPLHLAVVNAGTKAHPDDISIVQHLVEKGAKINEPLVLGTEFLKDEDKGVLYYGQTILQFAAANEKTEVVKYLVSAGADLTIVDVYGNNVLHVMAYHGNFEVSLFGFLKSKNADDIKKAQRRGTPVPVDITKARNKEQLTAYQLGISRGHVLALEAMKDVIWEFGVVRQYRICLDDLDPLQPHIERSEIPVDNLSNFEGTKNLLRHSKSAIAIAVDNKDKDILAHPLMVAILKIKWALYGRTLFLVRLALTFFLVACVTTTIALQPSGPNALADRRNYAINDSNRHPYVRGVFELLSILGTLVLAYGEIGEWITLGKKYFKGYGAVENAVQWLFAIMIWTIPAIRWLLPLVVPESSWSTLSNFENIMFGFSAIWGWFYILEFSKGFETLGPLLLIFKRMVLEDFLAWLVPYVVLTMGFACALFLQMQSVPLLTIEEKIPSFDWNEFAGAILWVTRFIFMQAVFDDFRRSSIPAFTEFLYIVYMFITQVVLFNVLIAMLAETLKAIAKDSERNWRVQFATILMQMDESMDDTKHKHILSHLGWNDAQAAAADHSPRNTPTPVANGSTPKPDYTASRYFIFTERETTHIDPVTNCRTTKRETLKLIVAKDHHGQDIEVRIDRDHWYGWTNDLMRAIWTGRDEKMEGGWWKRHAIRIKREGRKTMYVNLNLLMRKRVGDVLKIDHAHLDREC